MSAPLLYSLHTVKAGVRCLKCYQVPAQVPASKHKSDQNLTWFFVNGCFMMLCKLNKTECLLGVMVKPALFPWSESLLYHQLAKSSQSINHWNTPIRHVKSNMWAFTLAHSLICLQKLTSIFTPSIWREWEQAPNCLTWPEFSPEWPRAVTCVKETHLWGKYLQLKQRTDPFCAG